MLLDGGRNWKGSFHWRHSFSWWCVPAIYLWNETETSIGCGRFFEGTAEEMHTALNKTLAAIPDDTFVYVSPPFPHGRVNH